MRLLSSFKESGTDKVSGYTYLCPACKIMHMVLVKSNNPKDSIWLFNNNMVAPTFHPSIHVEWPFFDQKTGQSSVRICHHFIRNGVIDFCGDCTHAMAGQSVPLTMRDD